MSKEGAAAKPQMREYLITYKLGLEEEHAFVIWAESLADAALRLMSIKSTAKVDGPLFG